MALVLLLTAPWSATASAGVSPGTCATAGRGERYEPRTFFGYVCARDCEADKNGFAWAERLGIADPAACTLADPSAVRGCRAYAEGTVTSELAGFEWARENEIGDPCLCRGAGPGFEAGCRAYVTTVGE